jgi:hypothetical protein
MLLLLLLCRALFLAPLSFLFKLFELPARWIKQTSEGKALLSLSQP